MYRSYKGFFGDRVELYGRVLTLFAAACAPFCWANNPDCNLVNGAGLPARSFRSDDWPGITHTSDR